MAKVAQPVYRSQDPEPPARLWCRPGTAARSRGNAGQPATITTGDASRAETSAPACRPATSGHSYSWLAVAGDPAAPAPCTAEASQAARGGRPAALHRGAPCPACPGSSWSDPVRVVDGNPGACRIDERGE